MELLWSTAHLTDCSLGLLHGFALFRFDIARVDVSKKFIFGYTTNSA